MEHRLTWTHTNRSGSGGRVLYWMQASVRVRDNLALRVAQDQARSRGLPLEVVFCLDPSYPEATARTFAPLLDGLEDVAAQLPGLGLALTVVLGSALDILPVAGARAALAVFDRAYLPYSRRLRLEVAKALPCPVVMAEDNASVPVRLVSDRDEWAAATFRPRLMSRVGAEPPLPQPEPGLAASRPDELRADLEGAGLTILTSPHRGVLDGLGVDGGVPALPDRGGETAAWARWQAFCASKLDRYDRDRNDPNLDGQSGLSPALHYGHLSPVSLVADLKARGLWNEPTTYRKAGEDPVAKFLDEVLVRRELSLNFVLHNPAHATWDCLPAWARRTLDEHSADPRAYLYDRSTWEAAATHDAAWNAAQRQLLSSGGIHGYLRMYWGKKLLEWSATPAQAYADAVYLNNRYALDGRDPNSYAGIAWCFGKHDRPWGERPVYGLVRSMTEGGLRRKFDLDAYVARFTPPN